MWHKKNYPSLSHCEFSYYFTHFTVILRRRNLLKTMSQFINFEAEEVGEDDTIEESESSFLNNEDEHMGESDPSTEDSSSSASDSDPFDEGKFY
jgi:hypothetical protein